MRYHGPAIAAMLLVAGCASRPGTPAAGRPAAPAWGASDAQARAAKELGVPVTASNTVGMTFVLVPAGEFVMGSPVSEPLRVDDQEQPHRVRITRSFYLGTAEVTQRQWNALMPANPSQLVGDDLPVEHLSWNDADAFVQKLSAKEGTAYRLPTEAEWEYACRAGTTTPFGFGATITVERANYGAGDAYPGGSAGVGRQGTTSAGTFGPNAWGLSDMHGNVFEWCDDWWVRLYYTTSPSDDPPGGRKANDFSARILRGGAWYSPPWLCRSASRHMDHPTFGDDFYGMRLAFDAAAARR